MNFEGIWKLKGLSIKLLLIWRRRLVVSSRCIDACSRRSCLLIVPGKTEKVELNSQQSVDERLFAIVVKNCGRMVPLGIPAHISNEHIYNVNQVMIIQIIIY